MDLREKVKSDFPVLSREVNGERLVYLDSAATSLTPEPVVEAEQRFYRTYNANVHRGIHQLSEQATDAYENARRKVASFINAPPKCCIFTKSTTESINLVARAWGDEYVEPGDEILLTRMEHHSNIVPWQQLAERTGATLKYLPIDDSGCLKMDQLDEYISSDTALVAVTHASNVLGTINPIDQITEKAHRNDAVVVVDGAQSIPHFPVNIKELNVDFYAFSGHKMLGPTGVGVLYGREELLEEMPPFLGGGEMIRNVYLDHAEWDNVPQKFEAGTPNIAQAIGLSAAIDYIQDIGPDTIREWEDHIVSKAMERLSELDAVTVYGPEDRGSVISFTIEDVHPHDISTIVDQEGVAIRAGHHCAQPLMERLGVSATARASFYLYNDLNDVEALVDSLKEAVSLFSREPTPG